MQLCEMIHAGAIANRILVGVLIAAYMGLSLVGAGHSAGHADRVDGLCASVSTGSIDADGGQASGSSSSSHSTDGAESCFFCAHSPLVLLVTTSVIASAVNLDHRFDAAPHSTHVSTRGQSLARLRAPPVIS